LEAFPTPAPAAAAAPEHAAAAAAAAVLPSAYQHSTGSNRAMQQQQQQQLGECPSAIIEQGMFNLLFTLLVYVLNMIQVGVVPLL